VKDFDAAKMACSNGMVDIPMRHDYFFQPYKFQVICYLVLATVAHQTKTMTMSDAIIFSKKNMYSCTEQSNSSALHKTCSPKASLRVAGHFPSDPVAWIFPLVGACQNVRG